MTTVASTMVPPDTASRWIAKQIRVTRSTRADVEDSEERRDLGTAELPERLGTHIGYVGADERHHLALHCGEQVVWEQAVTQLFPRGMFARPPADRQEYVPRMDLVVARTWAIAAPLGVKGQPAKSLVLRLKVGVADLIRQHRQEEPCRKEVLTLRRPATNDRILAADDTRLEGCTIEVVVNRGQPRDHSEEIGTKRPLVVVAEEHALQGRSVR